MVQSNPTYVLTKFFLIHKLWVWRNFSNPFPIDMLLISNIVTISPRYLQMQKCFISFWKDFFLRSKEGSSTKLSTLFSWFKLTWNQDSSQYSRFWRYFICDSFYAFILNNEQIFVEHFFVENFFVEHFLSNIFLSKTVETNIYQKIIANLN